MELSSLILLSPLFLLSSLCFILLINNRGPAATTTTTVIKGYPFVGNLPQLLKNVHRLLEWSMELLVTTSSSTITLAPIIITSDPQVVEYIAKTRFDNYARVEEINAALNDLLGSGISNVNGDKWKLQREMASYEFNTKSLRSFVHNKVRYEIDNKLVPLLRDACNNGRVLDLQDVLERFTFANICNLVLGTDPDCLCKRNSEGERLYQAFGEAAKIVVKRGMKTSISIWRLKRLLNVGSERVLKESVAIIHEFVEKSIRSRRLLIDIDDGDRGGDFLSTFLDDERLSDEFLRDMLINFLFAGHTTPSALTWFFWNLSSNSDTDTKIHKELKSIQSIHNAETFALDDLREMNYLHAAITESLRLYPPIPLLPKKCLADDILPDGTRVKKGWMVIYHTYAMARKEEIWGKECSEFRPERWLDEEGVFRARNAFDYPVFHAGPRICLGKEMAYVQMKSVAASLLEGFEVEVVEERGEFEFGMTLRMRGGLPVRVKERSSLSGQPLAI